MSKVTGGVSSLGFKRSSDYSQMRAVPLGVIIPIQQMRNEARGSCNAAKPHYRVASGLCASSRGRFWRPRLPGPQFPPLGDGERIPFLPVGGPGWLRLSSAPPSFFVLAPQCVRSCLAFEAFVGRAAWLRPRPRYQRGEAAAGAGGASLGRRPRHVLDTGLSGLEPPHKGPGRRRNKGLFHAATEKPQISSRVLRRRGGAAGRPPGPLATALAQPCGRAGASTPTPALLLRIPLAPLPPRTRPSPGSRAPRVPVPHSACSSV